MEKVPKCVGKVPPEAPIWGSSRGPQKKERRMRKVKWVVVKVVAKPLLRLLRRQPPPGPPKPPVGPPKAPPKPTQVYSRRI